MPMKENDITEVHRILLEAKQTDPGMVVSALIREGVVLFVDRRFFFCVCLFVVWLRLLCCYC